MTFGTSRWGLGEEDSRAVFNAYADAGGNFVDTADVYSSGRCEEMLGGFIAERALRDTIVLATKSGFAAGKGPHSGGNGAKHIHAALDGSLKRLRTDYIDLYWAHVWDSVTPPEELLETMTTLVRTGKCRYWQMSLQGNVQHASLVCDQSCNACCCARHARTDCNAIFLLSHRPRHRA